ncbi:MAG: ATP-binding protein, partial [Woeseia sp.]
MTSLNPKPNHLQFADSPSEELFGVDDFFEMSLDNVCVAGLDGYFKRLSPSWTRTLGWSIDELMAKPSVEFVHPEDREMTLAGRERLRSGATMGPLTNRYLCKDGTFRWFEWRSVADNARGLVYAVARDVTEQKRDEQRLAEAKELQGNLQRQLIFADRMASVGTLAAGVAHEINNPLAFVTTNLTLAQEELRTLDLLSPLASVEELREMISDAQAGAERIRKIIRGLKAFSRAEEEQLAIIEVIPLLELSVNMTFNEIRHKARLVKDYGDIPRVEADEARLGQVFINLLINAAQALPEGDTAAHEIRLVTSTDAQGRAMIQVSDTGAGIPADVVERIFDPFFTTKPVGVGTGLGLSICHTIITGMGGEIAVDSKVGRGTTFRVVLPAAATVQEEVAASSSPTKEDLACATVLVVDDEPAIGLIFRRVLRDHEVTAVTTAREGLELLASGKHFDVIFSDLMMPEMSGMELFAELTRQFPHLAGRVVFISGGAFTPEAQAFLDRVGNERLDKPFDPANV